MRARIRPVVLPALLVAVLAAACDEQPAPEPPPSPSPVATTPVVSPATPTVVTTSPPPRVSACANEASVAADPASRRGSTVRADVDGDGLQDEIGIGLDPAGPLGCQAFLVVETTTEAYAVPVWEAGPEAGLPRPVLHGVVDLDGEPGDEILVDEAAGASTQFVGAFVFDDGALARITVEGGLPGSASGATGDLFAYGGSVGHIEAVDCAADGTFVVSTAVPGASQEDLERGVYDIERRFFTLNGSVLAPERTEREQVPIDRLERFPEFAAGPFGSC